MSTTPHLVVVGAGFAGLTLVRALRRAPYQVTLIDRRNHHLFQPLLYQVATAGLAPGDIAEPIRRVVEGQDNVEVRLAEVVGVDVHRQLVHLSDEESLHYDRLVLATGSGHHYFGHDEWAEHAPGLKTLGDALEIRRRVLMAFERAEWTDDPALRAALLTFVVVGAGPTGVELAGAVQEIATKTLRDEFRHIDPEQETRVILVEAGPDVLGTFPAPLPDKARRQLQSLGVEVRTGSPVQAVEADGVVVGGERIPAHTVIWAAGVRASPLGATLGVALDRTGRVIVGPDLSVPGHPEISVLGDLAAFHQDGAPLPGVAPVAIQQAKHLARNLRKPSKARPFRYIDRGSLATIGRRRAIAQIGPLRASGFFAWALWVFVHLMTLVGHRNRLVVFIKWAWAWVTWESSSRLVWQPEPAGPPQLPVPPRGPEADPPPTPPRSASATPSTRPPQPEPQVHMPL